MQRGSERKSVSVRGPWRGAGWDHPGPPWERCIIKKQDKRKSNDDAAHQFRDSSFAKKDGMGVCVDGGWRMGSVVYAVGSVGWAGQARASVRCGARRLDTRWDAPG